MNFIRTSCLAAALCGCLLALGAGCALAVDTTIWNFDGDFASEGGGPAVMEFFNADATFGTFGTDTVGGSSSGVLTLTAATNTQGLQVTHNVPGGANGGGSLVNEYTIMMDIKFPTITGYAGLMQTNTGNTNDGDWFRNADGAIGRGDYFGTMLADTWRRIGLVVNPNDIGNDYRLYIDGVEVGVTVNADTLDGRYSLDPFFLLMTDNDDETNDSVLSSVMFVDGPVPPAVIASMGGPTADGLTAPPPTAVLTVDRDTGAMSIVNNTGSDIGLQGYSITSATESLRPDEWYSITGNTDMGGTGGVDSNDNWTRLTAADAHGDLSEYQFGGDGATLSNSSSIDLGPFGGGPPGPWIKNYKEDLVFEYSLTTGETVKGEVVFSGNGGEPFPLADLNFDKDINAQDWLLFVAGLHTDLSGLSIAEAYPKGDLTGDLLNNYDDFQAFEAAYNAANGSGSFNAMLASIPEPSSLMLLGVASLFTLCWRRQT